MGFFGKCGVHHSHDAYHFLVELIYKCLIFGMCAAFLFVVCNRYFCERIALKFGDSAYNFSNFIRLDTVEAVVCRDDLSSKIAAYIVDVLLELTFVCHVC